MPWNISDVNRHKKGLTNVQKKKWVKIANGILKDSGDEGKAIRIANSKVDESVKLLNEAARRLDEGLLGRGINKIKAWKGGVESIIDMLKATPAVKKSSVSLVLNQLKSVANRTEISKQDVGVVHAALKKLYTIVAQTPEKEDDDLYDMLIKKLALVKSQGNSIMKDFETA